MIYAIGETVIDLIFKKMQPQAAKVGGSALNTAVSLGRLENTVTFISEIGNDELGQWCIDFLTENGVNTTGLICYKNKQTSLALAFLNEKNDAKYQFYKEFDMEMPIQNFSFKNDDILLFSSSFAINTRVRKSVKTILEQAKQENSILYYDPNMRKKLSQDSLEFSLVQENLQLADVVHISNEDAQAIFNTENVDVVFEELQKYGVSVMIYTQNKDDVVIRTKTIKRSYSVPSITPVSTIGAGDTFNAGFIHGLSKYHISKQTIETIDSQFFDDVIPFAIACSANVCMSIDNYIDKEFCEKLKAKN